MNLKKAVILAGGTSTRMGNVFGNKIKLLLPLDDGENILGRTVRLLKKNKLEDIVLVIGHQSNELKKAFGESVRYIEEPLYHLEGQLNSLYYAKEEFKEPFMFMFGDMTVSERALKKIINSDKGDIVCLVSDKYLDEESEKVKTLGGNLIACEKGPLEGDYDGEWAGIIKHNEKGAKYFLDTLEELKKTDFKGNENVRHLIERMAKRTDIKTENVSGEDWMEIDFPDEYRLAKKEFLYRIKEIDRN